MSDLDLFETERLVLSGWRMDQIDDLMRLHGSESATRYLTSRGVPFTRAQCEEAIAHWIDLFETRQLGKLRVRRKSDGTLVGRAGFGVYPPTGEAEIGYTLYEEFWGQGFAKEAAAGLRDWFFANDKGEHFIGMAHVDNAPSRAVLEKIGMEKTHQAVDYYGLPCQFHILRRP
ncbi:anhydro-N-acetylmuramic acid kinase [Devosia equisanguinis]|uniref:Anhydro-N-acetylmuramic acid kinase n=1 Tax=Devosia equisanguinis TaxID=2490941 RepID=A0A3S4CCH1_9HYPH|nr:GNAT family N-acetyltransferase [Devosia equisanguinis]VDS04033.1 anhydro-N-acetylmuramic acid kinase [Devosia equisanguinis]